MKAVITRPFLETLFGIGWIFIKNFAQRAYPLVQLTRKDVPFVFSLEQKNAQEDLKYALINLPAL